MTGLMMIDFDAAGGVDLDRLERSLGLEGVRVGKGRYRVSGGASEHWVDLRSPSHPRCDCGDHLWRDRICKHILAALLRDAGEDDGGAREGAAATLLDRDQPAARSLREAHLHRRAPEVLAVPGVGVLPAGGGDALSVTRTVRGRSPE